MSWQETLMGAVGVAFVGTLFVVLLIQGAATWRARMATHREDGYRRLAAESAEAQQRSAAALEQLRAEVADIRRLLNEVEEPFAGRPA